MIEQLIMEATPHSSILQVSAESGVSGLPKSSREGFNSAVTFPGPNLLLHCLYLAQNLHGKYLALLCGSWTLQLHSPK